MASRDKHQEPSAEAAEPDYEEVGADILASHARTEMHARVSSLRHRLKAAFSDEVLPSAKAKRRDE